MEFDAIIISYIISYFVIIGIAFYNDLGISFLSKRSTTKILIIVSAILVISIIFKYSPITHDKIDGLFSNMFKVSSILIALFLSYFFTKLYQIRNQKETRKKEIDKLAFKLTEFRRFLYYLMNARSFWIKYQELSIVKQKFKGLTYNDLHTHHEKKNKRISSFWLDDNGFSITRADIYLAADEIVGKNPLKWVLDEGASFDYSISDLQTYYDPSGTFWYYFSHKYFKYTKGLFDFHELNKAYDINRMKIHLKNIEPKLDFEYLDKDIIAEIGHKIHDNYLPKLFDLTIMNQEGMPSNLRSLRMIIILTIIFGVIFPLLFLFGDFNYIIDSYGSYMCVTVLVSCLIWIMLDFSNIIKNEIKVN